MIMGMVSDKVRAYSIVLHFVQRVALHLPLIPRKTYGMISGVALEEISSTL